MTTTGTEALVCADIARRQQLGIAKYGQTVADNPLELRAWLQHAYEEALDLPIYLRRAIQEIDATRAAADVLAERRRQISVEGWTAEHDDATHLPGELALAACCYCVADENDAPPAVWPWSPEWWKPRDRRRNMVRAAALLLAEIERHDRMEADIAENADHLAG